MQGAFSQFTEDISRSLDGMMKVLKFGVASNMNCLSKYGSAVEVSSGCPVPMSVSAHGCSPSIYGRGAGAWRTGRSFLNCFMMRSLSAIDDKLFTTRKADARSRSLKEFLEGVESLSIRKEQLEPLLNESSTFVQFQRMR